MLKRASKGQRSTHFMHAWFATARPFCSVQGLKVSGHGCVYVEAIRGGSSVQVDECGERLAVQMVRLGSELRPALLLHCE